MSDTPPDPADTSAYDSQLLALLDQYDEALAARDVARRDWLLALHPEIKPLVQCLEALDRMAIAPTLPSRSAEPHVIDDSPALAQTLLLDPSRAEQMLQAAADEEFPRTFGRYELLGELGRGGMGVVYQARQTDLNRTVALKMVRSQQLASAEELRRFQAEARAAARLRHPHVVSIHEIGQVGNQHYFTMDYVPGTSLAFLTARGPLDPETAANCLAHVSRAVHYLHTHGIIHRDLKPHNILVDPQGRPYVTDFGLAKIEQDSSQTQSGAIMGTPSYMSPEQAAGKHREMTHRSDVWSLGAILYEMLTGRPPFRADNYVDTLLLVMEGEPTLPAQLNKALPAELEWICMKCLAKDPAGRYTTAAELADDLERFTRGEPTIAQPTGYAGRLTRWARREPALAIRLVVLVTAMLIVQIRLIVAPGSMPNYPWIAGIFALWGIGGVFLQQLLNRPRTSEIARYAWSTWDIALFTLLILEAQSPRLPLLIGYPFFVAAAGLLFRVRLIVLSTLASAVSYLAVLRLCPEDAPPLHYSAVFVSLLAAIGTIVAMQVQRVRALSRFYDRPTSL